MKTKQNLLGDHSDLDPPDSMPNSEVKRISADGSVGLPHVRVGHRQALNIICLKHDLDKTLNRPLRSGSSVG